MATTDVTPPDPQGGSPSSRFSAWSKGVAAALLLLVVLLISALLALQGKPSQHLLAQLLEQWLSGPNGRVTVQGLHGQFPWEGTVGHLSWTDRDGTWLEIERLHWAWSPAALWRGEVQIQVVEAEQIHLYRQPRANPDGASEPVTPSSWSPLAHLPPVLVDRLHLTELLLDAEAYGQAARFSLDGEIQNRTSPASPTDPDATQWQAKLAIHPLDAGDTRLNLHAQLSPAGPLRGDSRLTLTLEGEERSGLLAALTGWRAAKGVHFHLTGHGPLAAWQGQLQTTVEGVGGVKGALHLTYTDHPVVQFAGRAEGDSTLLGAEWTALLVPVNAAHPDAVALDLNLEAEWLEGRTVRLRHLAIGSPLVQMQGQGTWAWPAQQGEATLQVTIPQLTAVSALTGLPWQRGTLSATLAAKGHWPDPHLQLTAEATDLAVATWQVKQSTLQWEGTLVQGADSPFHGEGRVVGLRSGDGPDLGSEPWIWSADLTMLTTGAARLTRMTLTDHNLTARLQGAIDWTQQSGQGQWQVTMIRLSDWIRRVVPDHAPIEGEGEWSGQLTLTPPGGLGEQATPFQLTTTLTGAVSSVQGLPEAAHILLGATIQTEANLSWAGKGLAITHLNIQGERMQWQGTGQVDLGSQQMTGQVQIHIPQLAPLSPLAGLPLKGDLWADMQLDGLLSMPHLHMAVHAPVIDVGKVHWERPNLLLVNDGWDPTPHGRLTLDLPGVDKKPLPMTGSYRLEETRLHLTDLHLPWPGGELTGEPVQVDWAQGIIDGQLHGKTATPGPWAEWLTGSIHPLASEWAGTVAVNLHWAGEGRRQNLEASVQGQLLRGGSNLLEKATLQARLADLWGKTNGTVEGKIHRLHWKNTQIHDAQWTMAGTRQSATVTMSGKGLLTLGKSPDAPFPIPLTTRPTPGVTRQEGFDWQVRGTLGMDDKGVIRGTLAEWTGRIGPEMLRLDEPAHLVLTPSGTHARGGFHLDLDRLALGYGPAHLDGHVHYDAHRVDMEGDLRLPLALVAQLGGPDSQGTARAYLKLSGSSNQPDGQFSLQLDQVHFNDPAMESIPPATLQADAWLEKGQVNLRMTLQKWTSSPMTALLLFPVQLGFVPFHCALPEEGAIGGTLNADAQLTQFALLANSGLMDSQKVDGLVHIALHLGGTVANPEVEGTVLVHNGSYENGSLGTLLKGVELAATAHGRTITIDTLAANDGGAGHLRATGQLALDVAQHWPFKLEATLEKALLIHRDEWQATLSGPLVVQGNGERMEITGDLTSNESLLYLAESESLDMQSVSIDREIQNGLHVEEEGRDAPESASMPVALNMTLHVPNRAFVRGRGLESEWQGDLTLRGLASAPRIEGQIVVRRGYFEFLDQRFDLRKGIIAFEGTTPPLPNLDLEAESKNTNNMVAVLSLKGPALSPTLTLSSDPDLPQDEILARLLFNRNRQQLTPTQALSLAMAVEKLRNGGPGLLGRARDTLKIDRLELGGDNPESGSVKAGKYLSDTVLLGVERGVKQGSGKVSVELEVMPNVVLQTEMDETNKSGVEINWKHDY